MADLTHMTGRAVQPAAALDAADPRHQVFTAASSRLDELIDAGDAGGLRRFIHDLENGDVWNLDPWRLLEHHALRAARRGAGSTDGDLDPPGAEPAVTT